MTTTRLVRSGLVLGESPRWHDGRLWLSDWGAGELLALDDEGRAEVVTRVEGFPFSFDWLPDGRLLLLCGRDGRLLRQEPDGSWVPHADLRPAGAPPWNEIVVGPGGQAYVNCTGFDFPTAEFAPGFIAVVAPDGSVRPVAGDVAFPNGMAISPDGATLVLAESYGRCLTAFTIAEDGSLAGRRTWADLGEGTPDGICFDEDGAIWYADVPNRRCVRVREGGEVLQEIEVDRGCFACMLGGADGRTLYVVAADWQGLQHGGGASTGIVLAARTDAAHAGWP